ncbi:MAG: isoleucine--tRNA ligase [Bacteroidales bacterium]|nr:isoleucine--tRNA ligase [Bacteroidales bacterium]
MSNKYPEYKKLDLSAVNREILEVWNVENTFHQGLETRRNSRPYIFYEGPPSANGIPGIHHVISRTIKDIVCRYKAMQGFLVERKAGWDTHGLPIELSVETTLGISKEDIGEKISIAEFNETCKVEVMRYTREWEDLTKKMGYWIDMDNPYVTYDNRYIETLWWLVREFYRKDLLYKGYSIQPYSPAAGTGLSTHELNQPGCYRDVKDTTCVAQFEVVRDDRSEFLFQGTDAPVYFLAWTTTPWTLPSNTALAAGADIVYAVVRSFNVYTHEPITVILAKNLLHVYFSENNQDLMLEAYHPGDKRIPYKVIAEYMGSRFEGISYRQLLNWVNPGEGAFKVLLGDFVTTEEGTGIVHIAPTFGADDFRIAQKYNVPALLVVDKNNHRAPLVDRKGRFFRLEDLQQEFIRESVNVQEYTGFAGRYVKNEYDPSLNESNVTVDIDIAVWLKKNNKAFRIEKHVHNYPHCWRTDKPILYYPMDAWFIKSTAMKEKLIALNNTINWKPESTGTGRFGKWLENLVDWNLSRSRFWGTPLPIWMSDDGTECKCIGSVKELKQEIDKAVEAGLMDENPIKDYRDGDCSAENYGSFDLHRPFVDRIFLVSDTGRKMTREPDLLDVWFDSGAMPYAQLHFPFAMKDPAFRNYFPADFIAEGVDQTRGWFFTLHAIASMLFDSVAFRNIISNGLVLDKNGNKMSKRLGNAVDPFETIEQQGSDPLRWYMMTNAQPWDNLKFDIDGIEEVKRKFFGTLFNTYSFFALYANIDHFTYREPEIPVEKRPEIDRWIISLLNSLVRDVTSYYDDYELTRAGRAIQYFVTEHLSNWYVRLNRKRYWGGDFSEDKLAAYQTLYKCLITVVKLSAPIAPFYMDKVFRDLNGVSGKEQENSVHLVGFPVCDDCLIDTDLEERMELAQNISSMILALRRKVNIKVRQPLQKIMMPVPDPGTEKMIDSVKQLILNEVNVKELEYLKDTSGLLIKRIKPNFKLLGPRYGKLMKEIAAAVSSFSQEDIQRLEATGECVITTGSERIALTPDLVEITSEDIPGWLVASEGKYTVALDVNITGELRDEGIAREFINRIQNIRKENGFEVTDKIAVEIQNSDVVHSAVSNFSEHIASQTLARSVTLVDEINKKEASRVEIDDNVITYITIRKI